MQRRFIFATVLGVAFSFCTSAQAADFPTAPINFIVNYGAGGNTDVASRQLATGMEEVLGQPVVVMNRPGGTGTIGPTYISRQDNDGYTIGVVTYGTQAIAPHMMTLSYGIDDFEYVAGFGRSRYGVTVHADSPYHNVQDLVDAAKTKESVFFGSPSTPATIAMFELGKVSGGKFDEILYKSGAETVMGLLSGQVEVIIQNPSDILTHLASGKLRLIAAGGNTRWAEYPDVPTMEEQGFPVIVESWTGLAAPKGTPKETVKALESAVITTMKKESVKEKFMAIGLDPVALTGEEFELVMKNAHDEMGVLIKSANIPRVN